MVVRGATQRLFAVVDYDYDDDRVYMCIHSSRAASAWHTMAGSCVGAYAKLQMQRPITGSLLTHESWLEAAAASADIARVELLLLLLS